MKKDLASDHSVYRFYKALFRLRRENAAFLDGDLQVLSSFDDPDMIFTRSLKGEKWAVICNFESEQQISLPFSCEKPALSNMDREGADGLYMPYECAVAKVISI